MKRLMDKLRRMDTKSLAKLGAFVVAMALCLGVLVFSLVQLTGILGGYRQNRQEYDAVRAQFAPPAASQPQAGQGYTPPESAPDESLPPQQDPAEVNADYVGWIDIPGTRVDYPVVRGDNNETYLTTSFMGTHNAAGAIFMDCANNGDFSSYNTVIFGHNVKSGAMFGTLGSYASEEYLAQNPSIVITLPGGAQHTYQIFAARKTDAWDAAYQTDFADSDAFKQFAAALGAPQGTVAMLTLSTCTNGQDDNERFLVHAALVA